MNTQTALWIDRPDPIGVYVHADTVQPAAPYHGWDSEQDSLPDNN